MAQEFIVAIDGTASSGKSTAARLAAAELGFLHLDTGAMYRAVTLKVIRLKIDWNDLAALAAMLKQTRIDFRPSDVSPDRAGADAGRALVFLDGENVTHEIRTPEVEKLVSSVSAIPLVRQHMVVEQRRIARGNRVICEGRDIGSVVFPNADIKFYFDAEMAKRVERRGQELKQKGVTLPNHAVVDNLTTRDYIDSTRACSPLTRVKDAIYLDTTNLSIDEEVMIVVNLVRMRMARKARPVPAE